MPLRQFLSVAFCAAALADQTYHAGPQVLTFPSVIDNSNQPYAFYLPNNYDPSKKYPLVISLHGEDSNHRLNLRRVFGKGNLLGETDVEAARHFPRFPDVDFVVACPLARGTMGYEGVAEQDVYDVLADVKSRFSIDEDRVYLTGLSMGGGGALWLGLTRPDVWAAVAPVCAYASEDAHAFVPNALNLPVHLFHGSLDPLIPAEKSRRWHHDLLESGAPAEYTEFPGVRHNAWDAAYKNGRVFTWFSQFRRNRYPDRVRFVSDRYRYRTAYWVQLDGLTPGTLANMDARFIGQNQIAVSTSNLDAFTLRLAGHPRYSAAQPLTLTIDGVKLRPSRGLSYSKTAKGWQAGSNTPHAVEKHAGQEGPMARVVDARQIYVYGTAGKPAIEELKARREQALEAADWSTRRSKLALSFQVLSDKEVRLTDWDSEDIVLLGTKESNELIGRLDSQLPLSLNVSAADYGLVFVYPVRGHYALVNSGLPWWTGAEGAHRGGLPFVPEKLRALETFQDYIVFKGSLENVILEGRFTRDWKLPAADAARLRAIGAIETK